MNVPEIRAELERLAVRPEPHLFTLAQALLTVGLRACDEFEQSLRVFDGGGWSVTTVAHDRVALIVDILREAGVEVEG